MSFSDAERAVDLIPPEPPILTCTLIWRGWDGDHPLPAFVQFHVEGATDNRTAGDDLGYVFDILEGTPPPGLELPSDPLISPIRHALYLTWHDGASWDKEPFLFRVAVRAVDRAGNESLLSNVVIVGHDGDMKATQGLAQAKRFKAYMDAAAAAAREQIAVEPVLSQLDAVISEAERSIPEPPSTMADVYNEATRALLETMTAARIDVIVHGRGESEKPPHDLPGFVVTRAGRALTPDELLQLRSLLLRPTTYTGSECQCAHATVVAFSVDGPEGRFYLTTDTEGSSLRFEGHEQQGSHALTTNGSTLLAGFCDGLFRLPGE
jgi:hypothetical protein